MGVNIPEPTWLDKVVPAVFWPTFTGWVVALVAAALTAGAALLGVKVSSAFVSEEAAFLISCALALVGLLLAHAHVTAARLNARK